MALRPAEHFTEFNVAMFRKKGSNLKQMGYSSRRPHRVPHRVPRIGNGGYNSHRLTKKWTIEEWKNVAWSDESQFLM